MVKSIIYFGIFVTLFACTNKPDNKEHLSMNSPNKAEISNPAFETVLGIQLGRPFDVQRDRLVSSKEIEFVKGSNPASDTYFIKYNENLKGILVPHFTSSSGIDILNSLVISFTDERYMQSDAMWHTVISPEEGTQMLALYIKKYGEGKDFVDMDKNEIIHRVWEKERITIEYIVTNELPIGTSRNVTAFVEYRFSDSIHFDKGKI